MPKTSDTAHDPNTGNDQFYKGNGANQEMGGLGEYKLRLFLFLFFFLKYFFLCSSSIPLLFSFSSNPLPNSCNPILLSELLPVLLTKTSPMVRPRRPPASSTAAATLESCPFCGGGGSGTGRSAANEVITGSGHGRTRVAREGRGDRWPSFADKGLEAGGKPGEETVEGDRFFSILSFFNYYSKNEPDEIFF
jgi:hypothetical protein